jgi:hypothetical protein
MGMKEARGAENVEVGKETGKMAGGRGSRNKE